jgi:hypothetical protein
MQYKRARIMHAMEKGQNNACNGKEGAKGVRTDRDDEGAG